jgi:hypothetical protein
MKCEYCQKELKIRHTEESFAHINGKRRYCDYICGMKLNNEKKKVRKMAQKGAKI